MSWSPRSAVALLAAVVLPAAQGCYEYQPIETTTPPVGEMVALEITDQGRVTLSERFGSGLAEIQGKLVARQGNEYVLNVFRVSQINGESAAWSGETTRIDRSFIGGIKGRQISPMRTTLASVIGAAAVYFIVSRTLTGSFTGGHDPEPPPPPLSTRIPLRLRF